MEAEDTPSLNHPTFLQRSTDRDTILEMFLDDLTQPSKEYPSDPIGQPEWGAIYTVGAHFAVKHPSRQDFFRHAGEPDYNIYRVPYEDILSVLNRYEIVLKTAAYPTVDEKLLRFEGFDHQLNDEIVPEHAEDTAFLTISESESGISLNCITTTDETVVEDKEIRNITVSTFDTADLPALLAAATSLYRYDSHVIPDNLSTVLNQG